MGNCRDCEHARLDELWGDYKCMFYKHRFYNPDLHIGCEHYEPKKEDKKEK